MVFSLCHLLTAPLPTCSIRASADAFPEQNRSMQWRIVCARHALPGGHVICGARASNSPKVLATHTAHTNSSAGSVRESATESIPLGTSDCVQREQQSRRERGSQGPI